MIILKNTHVAVPWLVTAFGDATYKVEEHTHTHHAMRDEDFQLCTWSEATEHTARLISAAPILLAALQAIVESLSDQDDEGLIEHSQQMIDARAAIAKATGEQS